MKANIELEPYEFTRTALRHQVVDTCAECGDCDGSLCEPVRNPLREYDGIRFTSDGFDCALPVSIDSHSHCSYGCLYCFSDNLTQHREQTKRPIGQMSLKRLENIFRGEGGVQGAAYRKALRYDKRNEQGYPTAVQVGAINDPCDNIERQQGWLLSLIDLAIKYRQPLRLSTKGTLLSNPDYLRRLQQAPELFWVHFSIISPDDKLMERIDRRAPLPSERLASMKALTDIGVKCSLRFRPILPGLSDSTPDHPYAWRDLIDMSAEAGACAISYEVGFVPGIVPDEVKWRWSRIESITGIPFLKLYRTFGPVQACMRPPYTWVEEIMHRIKERALEHSLSVGVSDPVWKQLGETGCCCGIEPDDPVFGNWEVESATNQLLLARDTGKLLTVEDITPAWAYDAPMVWLVNMGPGPKNVWRRKRMTWADKLAETWNDIGSERGPLSYFQGALMPDHRDEHGNMVYRYEGLKRQHLKAPYWNVKV